MFSISTSQAMLLRQQARGVVSNVRLVHHRSLCISCVSTLVMLSLIPLTNITNKMIRSYRRDMTVEAAIV